MLASGCGGPELFSGGGIPEEEAVEAVGGGEEFFVGGEGGLPGVAGMLEAEGTVAHDGAGGEGIAGGIGQGCGGQRCGGQGGVGQRGFSVGGEEGPESGDGEEEEAGGQAVTYVSIGFLQHWGKSP